MKKQIAFIAIFGALCFSTIGVLTSCSEDNKDSGDVEITTAVTAVTAESEKTDISATQAEVIMQSIPITSDNAKLQSRTVMKDDVLWLVQSGSSAEFIVSGKNAAITIAGSSGISSQNPRYAVYVDDKQVCDSIMNKQEETVSLWTDTDTTAYVKVILLSEAKYGGVGIRSVNVDSSSDKPVTSVDDKSLKIEFIGDSITCGYGVEGKRSEAFSTSTENFTKSYAYLTAKALDADYTTCCYSGYGIVSGYSADGKKNDKELMPQCYGLTSNFKDYYADWEFSDKCDVIVINLGTNDMNYVAANPETNSKEFQDGYKAFLLTVREKNPDALIICTVGTMGGDEIYKLIECAIDELGDGKITSFFSPTQSVLDDMGPDGHPSKKTQQYIADIMTDKIRHLLAH